jgi:hypothetical protein
MVTRELQVTTLPAGILAGTMRKLVIYFAVGVVALTACSDRLNRKRALDLVMQLPGMKNASSLEGTALEVSVGRSDTLTTDHCGDPYELKENKEKGFLQAGIIVVNQESKCGSWDMALSPMAKKDARFVGAALATVNISKFGGVRVDDIYQESPTRATVRVIVDFPLTESGKALLRTGHTGSFRLEEGCELDRDRQEVACATPIKMLRYDDGWNLDKEELARQEAAQRQADQEFLRQLHAQSEIESEKAGALRAQNEEMERQIKRDERDLALDKYGPTGKPPKPLTAQQKRNCEGWGDPNPGVPTPPGESQQYCP